MIEKLLTAKKPMLKAMFGGLSGAGGFGADIFKEGGGDTLKGLLAMLSQFK